MLKGPFLQLKNDGFSTFRWQVFQIGRRKINRPVLLNYLSFCLTNIKIVNKFCKLDIFRE